MKNNAIQVLIITAILSFVIGGVFGYVIRSKVDATASDRLARNSDVGFDWYLGDRLVGSVHTPASNIVIKATQMR